jgi:hypothetical protein
VGYPNICEQDNDSRVVVVVILGYCDYGDYYSYYYYYCYYYYYHHYYYYLDHSYYTKHLGKIEGLIFYKDIRGVFFNKFS